MRKSLLYAIFAVASAALVYSAMADPLTATIGVLRSKVAAAQPVTTTNNYSITVTVTPAITAVNLSNTAITTGPVNAGTVVGAVSVTTNPPGGTYSGVITLGGTNASSFALTNGGHLPCNLTVGTNSIAAGTYAITLSATQ